MKKPVATFAMVIVAAVLIIIPIIIFFLKPRIREVSFFLPASLPVSYQDAERYTVVSQVANRKLVVTDPSFVKHVAAKWEIFEKDAIVDPLWYRGNLAGATRYTVSNIRFVLAPMTKNIEIVNLSGAEDFGAKATYGVEGDTLVVTVFLDETNTRTGTVATKNDSVEMFLRAALTALYYAKGGTDGAAKLEEVHAMEQAIQTYIEELKVYPWPVDIEGV